MAHASGQTAKAAELGRASAELGRRFDVPDLEMLGLALEGAALVAWAQVEEGMRCLDEATAAALQGEAEIPISGAWACCFLVSACTAVRDYERAFEWCDRIAEFAERYGSRYMLAFCRAEYGAVHLWRGRWTDAEAVLEASIEDFSRSRPAMVGGPLVGLAELRRRQGRREEAVQLLDRPGPVRTAQLCRARLALDRGETPPGGRAGRALPAPGAGGPRARPRPGLELLVRARTARGELEEARAALEALREIERAVGTEPLRASIELAEGLLAAAGGEHDRARPAARGRDRSLRAERRAVRGSPGADRARHHPRRARSRGCRRARGDHALDQLLELGAEREAERGRSGCWGRSARDDAGPPLAQLTPREREVLRLVTEGLTNRQIAERLGGQRAHRPPPRHESAAQARPALAAPPRRPSPLDSACSKSPRA